MHALIVEDKTRTISFLKRGLKERGHAVDVVISGQQGLDWVNVALYDQIIPDIMLPQRDGLSICQEWRN